MSKLKLSISVLGLVLIFAGYSYGQGCSDAGICTIDGFKPHGEEDNNAVNNQIKVGAFYGNADNAIAAYGAYMEYNRQLTDRFGVDVRLTTLAQSGNGISVFGLSDIYLTANYKVNSNFQVTLGTKIPLSDGGASLNDLPLPMDYQASLGTLDLIFGIGYQINKLQLVAAIQQPLTQNSNRFLNSLYPEESPLSTILSTNNFQRRADVLLRASYPISLNQKLRLTPSLLPIYHLANDSYTDEFDIEQEISGSQGLTLNANVYLDYDINDTNAIQLNVGFPLIVREARPDGLTRSYVVNLEYRIRF